MTTAAPPPTPEAPRPRPAIGTVDVMEIFLGARGSGKSVAMVERARELQAELGGAWIIGAGIGQRMPVKFLDGSEVPITYHRSIEQLQKGLQAKPNRWHIVAPPHVEEDKRPDLPRSTADDLVRYSIRLSAGVRDQAWKRANPARGLFGVPLSARFTGLPATPIIVMIDEGVALAGAAGGDRNKAERTDWFKEFLISLRHYHVIFLYCAQGATMRSWHLLEQATAIHCYQTTHEVALNSIRQAGATAEQLEQIRTLPLYSYVTIVPIAKADRAKAPPPADMRPPERTAE